VTWLFDSNVLLAGVLSSHSHHTRAHEWLRSQRVTKFATCVITQGALLRLLMRFGRDQSASAAWRTLELVSSFTWSSVLG
jgi:predicted nucleic acid-binding protein